jgi:iron-sulfur cluster repair protein YtfE (RIC family)
MAHPAREDTRVRMAVSRAFWGSTNKDGGSGIMSDPTASQHEINERIRQEHDRLRDLLGLISREMSARKGTAAEIARQLRSLRDQLNAHFVEEEDHGFFEQITSQAPRFSRETSKLCDEHVDMLNKTDKLISDAEEGDGSDNWWSGLVSAFHDLSRELMQHEHEENELLQQVYFDDIGEKD